MTYKSNVDKVLSNLKLMLGEKAMDSLYKEVAEDLYASNSRRVFNEGKAVDGSKIGEYSRKPLYVNPRNSPKSFKPMGKTGRTKFQDGRPHKTKYFSGGYRGFRTYIGRTGYVNLQLTGTLFGRFNIFKTYKGYAIGFFGKHTGKKSAGAVSEGLEKHFGKKIWGVNAKDRKVANAIVERYVKKNAKS